jgi:2'-5' RNA ligase
MKRIFIEVEIPDHVRQFAAEHIGVLRKIECGSRVGWAQPAKMHLTLRFLGEIDDALIAKVNESVITAANAHSSFRLTLAGTGVFPNKNRPKVLWLGINDRTNDLLRLRNDLDESLERIGFEREKRGFRPHLTIARLRETKGTTRLVETHVKTEFEPIKFGVSEIAVMVSRLERAGSVYTKLFSSKLS